MARCFEVVVALALPLSVPAWPSMYACDFDCLGGHHPGDNFGMMTGVPNFGPAPTGPKCKILADGVPTSGFIDGNVYNITIASTTPLLRKVACNEHASFISPSTGAVVNSSAAALVESYSWTAAGTGDVSFRALCGAGGSTNQMWVADALTIPRDASQGPAPSVPTTPAPTPLEPTPTEPADTSPGAVIDLSGDGLATLSWTIDAEGVDMTISLSRNSWVGFGISSGAVVSMDGGGDGSDVLVCHGESPLVVERYWISSKARPSGGVDMAGAGATCTREGGITTLSFRRPLDATGNQRALTPGSLQPVIYAFGDHDSFSFAYHNSNRGGLSIDFANGAVAEATKKSAEAALLGHMICMIVCWGGFLPWGVAIASRTRNVTGAPVGAWFKRHRLLQSVGLVGMLCGFAFAIRHVQSTGGAHFNGPHTRIGAFVVITGALQPLNAFFRPHPPKEGEKKTTGRLIFEIWHKGGGRIACFFGILNVLTGIMVLAQHDYNNVAIATAVTLAILCIGPVIEFFVHATLNPDNVISRACVGASESADGDDVEIVNMSQ